MRPVRETAVCAVAAFGLSVKISTATNAATTRAVRVVRPPRNSRRLMVPQASKRDIVAVQSSIPEEYVQERLTGRYGHPPKCLRRFRSRLLTCSDAITGSPQQSDPDEKDGGQTA